MTQPKAETTKLYMNFGPHRCAVCGEFIGFTEESIRTETILCSKKCRDEWVEGRFNLLKVTVGG